MLSALAAIAIGQAAAPSGNIYLKCVTTHYAGQTVWDITLNEAAGTVDYSTAISGQQRQPARFSADAVYFIGFTLSRQNLSLQRQIGDQTESGTCQVVTAQKRAF